MGEEKLYYTEDDAITFESYFNESENFNEKYQLPSNEEIQKENIRFLELLKDSDNKVDFLELFLHLYNLKTFLEESILKPDSNIVDNVGKTVIISTIDIAINKLFLENEIVNSDEIYINIGPKTSIGKKLQSAFDGCNKFLNPQTQIVDSGLGSSPSGSLTPVFS